MEATVVDFMHFCEFQEIDSLVDLVNATITTKLRISYRFVIVSKKLGI